VRIFILIASALLATINPLSAGLIMTVNASMGSNAAAAGGGPDQDVSSTFPLNTTTYSTSSSNLAASDMNATWDGSALNVNGFSSAYGSGSLAYSTMDLNFTFDESYYASFTFSKSGDFYTVPFYLRNLSNNQLVYNGNTTPTSTITVTPGIAYRLYLEYKVLAPDPSGQSGSVTASATFSSVPEPSTWALMMVALVGLGAAVRFKARRA
jgi:hypothetical protein